MSGFKEQTWQSFIHGRRSYTPVSFSTLGIVVKSQKRRQAHTAIRDTDLTLKVSIFVLCHGTAFPVDVPILTSHTFHFQETSEKGRLAVASPPLCCQPQDCSDPRVHL